jgi:thiamine biosynthesis lipoprotein
VGIRDPLGDGSFLTLRLTDAYAITSGGYQRYFEQDGKTYHHILDPATGCPADSGLLSVTVVADANGPQDPSDGSCAPGNGTMCDAFSTALFVMGEDRAIDFWRGGGYDFDMVLVTQDHRVVITAGLADRFTGNQELEYTYEVIR